MNLSLHADYSCRVLIFVAVNAERVSSVKEISEAYGISQNHLVKVVHKLSKLGFIKTTQGRGGGMILAKKPQDIVLGDVIRKMESNFFVVECFDKKADTCLITNICTLKHVFHEATQSFLRVLDQYTVQDLIGKRPDALKSLLTAGK